MFKSIINMQEREFPTLYPATYLATGHLRQHPIHFYRLDRTASWTDVVGVIDLLWAGDPDPMALLAAKQDYDTVRCVVIPSVDDAVSLSEWSSGPLAKSVNALCHSGNSNEQLARVVCAMADYVPIVVPIAPPIDVACNDAIFHSQGASATDFLAGRRGDATQTTRIVKCRAAYREMPNARPTGSALSSAIAGIEYRESFTPQALAFRDKLEMEVLRLNSGTTPR